MTKRFRGKNSIENPESGFKVIRVRMEFANGIKVGLTLAEQADIREKGCSYFYRVFLTAPSRLLFMIDTA